MLNGHIARNVVKEGQQILDNYANTSSRTARRYLARYLTNPAGVAVLEVCFALNTGAKLTPKQYKDLQDFAAANHKRFVGFDGVFELYCLEFVGAAGSPTKGTVTYTYRVKEDLGNASTSTYRQVVRDILRLVEHTQDFDDDAAQTLLKTEAARKARRAAERERDARLNRTLARMFGSA